MKKQALAKIISNRRIQANYYHCVLQAPQISKAAKPGQFVNIKISEGLTPLLRRPFSIHNSSGRNIEILYEVLGEGTKILSSKRSGESLDIIGPLGNGFLLKKGKGQIILAGGMGVAPLVFLAKHLFKEKPQVLIGAKNKEQVLCVNQFRALGLKVEIATEDGSLGCRGRATDLLKKHLDVERIYSCGPKPMLKAVSEIAHRHGICAQLSLEEHMGCAIGACLGCVVMTRGGLKRVCKEGPVFEADELIWER